ncbi:MAG: M48 family metalloprotease [Pseudomonadales bacterium]
MNRPLTILCLSLALLTGLPMSLSAMSVEKEIELGKTEHKKIVGSLGIYRDHELQAYVDRVGQRVAEVSSRPELEYTFTVINDDMINAFALPGGFIYITRGMLAHVNSESQLAAILGHEIAHVTEKHALKTEGRNKGMRFLNILFAAVTGIPGIYELTDLFGGVLLSGYSRDLELEADEVGAEYMAKAGYSPEAMIDTIDILKAKDRVEMAQARKENREPRVYHGFLSTHPDHDTRYELAIRESQKLVTDYDEFIEADEFLRKLNGLAYGASRQVGVVRGNQFYHPKLGIKFNFPDDWRFSPEVRGVAVTSQTGEANFAVSTLRIPANATPEEAAVNMGLEIREGRAITIAGMPAYLGIANGANSTYGPRPGRFAIVFDTRRRVGYLLMGTGKHDLRKIANDKDFIATIFSFDLMDKDDFRLAKRPKVQVVRAEEGTTMEQLAEESPITNYALESLRLMNGLYPKGQPEPGQLIKIVQ